MLARPFDGFLGAGDRHPDRRMRLLHRARPDGDVFVGPKLGLLLSDSASATGTVNGESMEFESVEYDANTFLASLKVGAGYEYKLKNNWVLRPEASYEYALTGVTDEDSSDDKLHLLEVGCSLFF